MPKGKSNPISRLGHYAHPPKTNINFAKPPKAQTEARPHIAGPKGDKGGKQKHPGAR